MTTLRTLLTTVALLGVTEGTAAAQPVSYITTARFTSGAPGCNQLVALSSATCSNAGFSLLFMGATGLNIGNGSVVSLGTFFLTGSGTQVVPPGVVTFELFINQTMPSIGNGTFAGSISGTVTTGPDGNFSSLIWAPNSVRGIGVVTYTLIFDNIGPAAGRGLGIPINNERGINALVTTNVVPEPGTTALFAAGGLLLLAYALRKKAV